MHANVFEFRVVIMIENLKIRFKSDIYFVNFKKLDTQGDDYFEKRNK